VAKLIMRTKGLLSPSDTERNADNLVPFIVTANVMQFPSAPPPESLGAVALSQTSADEQRQSEKAGVVRTLRQKRFTDAQSQLLRRVDEFEIKVGWMTRSGDT